jgi:hypothetical protein
MVVVLGCTSHPQLKLDIDIGEGSVSKYLVRRRKPPSPTLRTFLEDYAKQLVSKIVRVLRLLAFLRIAFITASRLLLALDERALLSSEMPFRQQNIMRNAVPASSPLPASRHT